MPKTKSIKKPVAQGNSMQAATWGIIAAAVVIVGGVIFVLTRPTSSSSNSCIGAKGPGTPVTTASGLQYEDLVLGNCAQAMVGKQITVHYVGTLTDGTKFDSSRDRNQPFSFALGTGAVIAGWDEGIAGMKVGGTRRLTIPANLGYGDQGRPPTIPGGATLIFEVELLDVK